MALPYLFPSSHTPLKQGDIFVNIPYWRPHRKKKTDPWPNPTQKGGIPLDLQSNQYAVLITQTCDLSSAKEFLFVVAALAETTAEALKNDLDNPLTDVEFRNWIVRNRHIRFHFFEQFVIEEQGEKKVILPELVVNFRSPFTLRADYVKERLLSDHRILSLTDLYSAEIGNRFGYYYSRVATDRQMISI